MVKSIVPIGTIKSLVILHKKRRIYMFFQRLKDLREDMDMNQTQIAELLFTSQTVYSRYERGARTIPVEHLIILADFYNVSVDYILGRTNNKDINK